MKTTEHFKKLIEIFRDSDSKFKGVLNALRYDVIETNKRNDERSLFLLPATVASLLGQTIVTSFINILQPYGPDFVRGWSTGWRPKNPDKYYWDNSSERYVRID